MYATIRSYPGNTELAGALVENESAVKGLVSGIDGFRAYYVLRAADGSPVTVSVYDDQSGVEESTRQAAAWVGENLPDLEVSPDITSGEVIISA